jgi:divalent metal cation (Fe/Co/Zn/Cd) transporter
MSEKKFYKSKTLIIATIGLILLFVNFFYPDVLPLDQINNKLNDLFLGSGDQVEGLNWGALFSIISMIALRFVTKKELDLTKKVGSAFLKARKKTDE